MSIPHIPVTNCFTSLMRTSRPTRRRSCFTHSARGVSSLAYTTCCGTRRLLFAAAQLLGGAVRFWHDQIFYKPARHGGIVIWHQDYSYWTRTTPLAHISCWIGLDDSTRDNGCVHYVPGSHRWQLLPRASFANDMDAVLESLTPAQRAEFKPVPIELKAGECSFHHPLMVHGSYANRHRSAPPRRGAERISRWCNVGFGRAVAGRRAADPCRRKDRWTVLSLAVRSCYGITPSPRKHNSEIN